MDMLPTVRETFTKGEDAARVPPEFPPDAQTMTTDAWHYAGTVPHTKMKVNGLENVFIGDASALLTPFNCHTSMPAVAAGILAARAATGLLDGEENTLGVSGPAPVLFAVGAWIILVGVAVHTVKKLKSHHYWLMPLGVAVIGAGIVAAVTAPHRLRKGTSHAVTGYIVAAVLVVQVSTGSWLRPGPRSMWLRKTHRATGIAAMVGLNALYLGATVNDDGALAAYTSNVAAYEASAWVYLAASVAVSAKAALWFRPDSTTSRGEPLL